MHAALKNNKHVTSYMENVQNKEQEMLGLREGLDIMKNTANAKKMVMRELLEELTRVIIKLKFT